jgi:hypothetical protein
MFVFLMLACVVAAVLADRSPDPADSFSGEPLDSFSDDDCGTQSGADEIGADAERQD